MKIRYLILLILITSCGGFAEVGKVLRNEKVTTTDEFLIEKRGPLSIPPNVMELPKPKNKSVNENDSNSVKKTSEQDSNINKNKSSLEKLILEEIKNN
tara:strand:+ start:3425 stop:3718 length:294 start_codon:yes stop_codon:yes gene_type:complete